MCSRVHHALQDAGAKFVEVRLKDYGGTSIEVIDNGTAFALTPAAAAACVCSCCLITLSN